MLNGAKVIEAIDKGKEKASNDIGDDLSSPVPDALSLLGNVKFYITKVQLSKYMYVRR